MWRGEGLNPVTLSEESRMRCVLCERLRRACSWGLQLGEHRNIVAISIEILASGLRALKSRASLPWQTGPALGWRRVERADLKGHES